MQKLDDVGLDDGNVGLGDGYADLGDGEVDLHWAFAPWFHCDFGNVLFKP